MRLIAAVLLFIFFATNLIAQKTVRLSSPNGKISYSLWTINGRPAYTVAFNNQVLVDPSTINFVIDSTPLLQKIKTGRPLHSRGIESYKLLTGKVSSVQSPYNQVIIPLEDKKQPSFKIEIEVRAFNDGLAFRYQFKSGPRPTMLLNDEQTTFSVHGDPILRALLLPNFTSSHEGRYTTKPLREFPSDTLMDMPALFDFNGKTFMAITEANLLDYAGMYLMKKDGKFRSVLSPLPFGRHVTVMSGYPHYSPWRVLMISDRAGALIESTILTSLAEPNRLKETDWLKPGKTTFPWWNGNVLPDTINAPGNNFVTQKYYIDFCARNNLEYHSVVEYGLHQWYVDDGVGFSPGPNSDPTRAVPGLDMKEVCDYAKSKNVGVRVWVHWAALYPKIDSAFSNYEKWGLSGMMIDFMDRDDQEMVNIQTEMLEKAAKHHLHVQFHGAYKPTGLSRTYPNEFTREGTLNYEVNKWSEGLDADHDLDIVFTRMLAGSTDYHLGGFRAVPDAEYRTQYTRPLMHGTRCHMLAMYVVLENALGMVCDYPEAYEGQPGFDFIRKVPTTWDETVVVSAIPSDHIVIARRKNSDWYLGALNKTKEKNLRVKLNFLGDGEYQISISQDADEPNKIRQTTRKVKRGDEIELQLAAGGGAVMEIKK